MALLIGLNVLWSGIGNIAVGDIEGYGYALANIVIVFLSVFTFGIPLVLFCVFCSMKGYEYLKQQAETATAARA